LLGLISGTNLQVALPNRAAPRILCKSWTLIADIEVPEDGGLVGGYGLHVRDGKPTFVYNCLVLDRFTFPG
jgi:arylsulfatase